jgi:hypothetical protein
MLRRKRQEGIGEHQQHRDGFFRRMSTMRAARALQSWSSQTLTQRLEQFPRSLGSASGPYGRVNLTVTVMTTAVGTPFSRDG